MTETQRQLAEIQAHVARLAASNPQAVIVCALEVLIEVAAGDNPALRDIKKLHLYRGIAQALAKRGLR